MYICSYITFYIHTCIYVIHIIHAIFIITILEYYMAMYNHIY